MRQGIDVCVVSYHTPTFLDKFLFSHAECSPSESSLWVRVNDPLSADEKVVEAWSFLIDGLYMGHNFGYARSINDLATRGDREIIGIFNADVEFLKYGDVEECANQLLEHDDWAILGPKQANSKGKITHAGIMGTNTSPNLRGFLRKDRPLYGEVAEAVSVSGSAYFIKRSVWEELTNCEIYQDFCRQEDIKSTGAFLPTNHMYEETWCSYQAREHGYKVMYYGPVCMIHEWHASTPRGDIRSDGQERKSRKLFRAACGFHGIECN